MPFEKTATPPPRINTQARDTARETRQVQRKQEAVSKKTKERAEGLIGIAQLASFGCIIKGQYADAGAIAKHGPNLALEAAKLGESNDQVGKALDTLNATGPYAGLIAVGLPLVLQLLANHGKIKPEAVAGAGVVSPASLEAETKTSMMKQQAEALRAQQAAERELMLLAAEMEMSANGVGPPGAAHGN